MIKKKFYTVAFIVYAVIVFTLSSYPRLNIPISLHSKFLEIDKLGHFLQYFLFAFLYYKFRLHRGVAVRDVLIELFFLGFIVPLLDELHQIPIPGRTFEWFDVLADVLGVYCFMVVVLGLRRLRMTNYE